MPFFAEKLRHFIWMRSDLEESLGAVSRLNILAAVCCALGLAPASAAVITTAPAKFCSFPGTYTEWMLFDFQNRRLRIPMDYVNANPLGDRLDANLIGFLGHLDVVDFSPRRVGRGGRAFPDADVASLTIGYQDELNRVAHRIKRYAFIRHRGDEAAKVWEQPLPNGLSRVSSTLPEAGETTHYLVRDAVGSVTEVVSCPSESWKPIGPKGHPLCQMAFRHRIGIEMTFDKSHLGDWRAIRDRASDFIECALSSGKSK